MPRYTIRDSPDFDSGVIAGQQAVSLRPDRVLAEQAKAWANVQAATVNSDYLYWSGYHVGTQTYRSELIHRMRLRMLSYYNERFRRTYDRHHGGSIYHSHIPRIAACLSTLRDRRDHEGDALIVNDYVDIWQQVGRSLAQMNLQSKAVRSHEAAIAALSTVLRSNVREARSHTRQPFDDDTFWSSAISATDAQWVTTDMVADVSEAPAMAQAAQPIATYDLIHVDDDGFFHPAEPEPPLTTASGLWPTIAHTISGIASSMNAAADDTAALAEQLREMNEAFALRSLPNVRRSTNGAHVLFGEDEMTHVPSGQRVQMTLANAGPGDGPQRPAEYEWNDAVHRWLQTNSDRVEGWPLLVDPNA